MPKRKAEDPPEEKEEDALDGEQEGEEEEEEEDDEDSFPSASSESEESADDADGEAYKEINVEFEFFDPKEKDFHGLKALLHTYLDGQQFDCSGLVDAVIKKADCVGTVVKTAEDDDPIAVMTVFNTVVHAQQEHMKQIKEFITSKCTDSSTREKLTTALQSKGTGLVVSERLINCPPKLAPPLVQLLFDEVDNMVEDGETQEERDEYKLGRFLFFTRVYSDPLEEQGGKEAGGSGGAGPSTSSAKQRKAKGPTIVYVRPEDEYMHQLCAWSYTFPVEGRPVAKDELQPLRLVMMVDANKVPEARQMMELILGNMLAEGK